jgi:PAS domain S-box-containing protein
VAVKRAGTIDAQNWLTGGGTMGEMIRDKDWSATPLGPLAAWPQSLRVALNICLNSRFPMFVWWGRDFLNLHNDAYIPMLGQRHPDALGQSAREVWREVWTEIGPRAEAVLVRGEATWSERQRFVVERNGYPEEGFFTFSHSPIRAELGDICGVLCAVTEETRHVMAEADHKRLLAQLDSERARLAEVFQRSPSFMTVLRGPRHVFELANDRYYQLVGHRTLIGRPAAEAFPEIEGQGFFELLDRVYTTGEPFIGKDMRIMLQREPGQPLEERFIEFVYQPTRGPGGEITGIFAHGIDLTERKRLEGQAQAILESITDAFVAVDREWRFTYVNAQAERVLGRETGDLLGKVLWEIYPGLEGSEFQRLYHRAADGGIAGSVTCYYPDHDRWYEVHAYPAHVGISVYFRDVTEMKRAEAERQELAAQVQRQAHLFDLTLTHINDFAYIFDLEGRFVYINRPLLELWGLTLEQARGKNFFELQYPNDLATKLQRQIQQVIGTKKMLVDETPYTSPSGVDGYYEYIFSPVFGADGAVESVVGSTRVITERKRAEAERHALLDSERAARAEAERAGRMKDEFLATLSHELRTPLNAILGWSQILSSGAHDEEDLAEGLKTIERNARAQTKIIEDLLDMSRIISGKVRLDVQRVELAPVVQAAVETVRPAADGKGIRIHTVLDPMAGPISGDPNRLQQIFWNLLSNAVKFTPRGGRVQVLLERVNSHLEVSIIDSGEGIRPEFLPFVFDRFRQSDASTTRKHGGLGLGLAIVMQLAQLHGGTVRAKSPGVGQGATFTVSLPIVVIHAEPEPSDERRHPRADPLRTVPSACNEISGVRVLVVDDEPDARALIQRLLEDCNAVVTLASSAEEAMEKLAAERPDVFISDIGMPGTDGYELIRRVRRLGPEHGGNTPAVALTAYARSEDRIRAVTAGFQHHVAKPVEPAELITMVANLAPKNLRPS